MYPNQQMQMQRPNNGQFTHDLFSCCDTHSCPTICYFLWCPLCAQCDYADKLVTMDPSKDKLKEYLKAISPYLVWGSFEGFLMVMGFTYYSNFYSFLGPLIWLLTIYFPFSQRQDVKDHFGIPKSTVNDCCVKYFCNCCAQFQEMAEIELKVNQYQTQQVYAQGVMQGAAATQAVVVQGMQPQQQQQVVMMPQQPHVQQQQQMVPQMIPQQQPAQVPQHQPQFQGRLQPQPYPQQTTTIQVPQQPHAQAPAHHYPQLNQQIQNQGGEGAAIAGTTNQPQAFE